MPETQIPRRLKMLGMLLFLLGLITGFALTNFKNPRMGLAAHLEGVMNGVFLVVAGLIWNDLNISNALKKITCGTLIYGTYVNWFITLLAALLGTSKMTPITGSGFNGTPLHEQIVNAGFISVGLTMVFSLLVIVYGLRSIKFFKTVTVVIACIVSTSFTHCQSQSLVGKWKMVSTTSYFTAEGAARQGKDTYTNAVPSGASIISEFKSDHTYVTTTSSATSPTPNILGGNWSLTGDRLTITVDPKYKPTKELESSTITISITGNTMIMTNNIIANPVVSKMTTKAERI